MVAYRSLYLVLTMLLSGSVFTYPLQGSSAPQSLSLSRRSTPGNGAGLPGPPAPQPTQKSQEELENERYKHLRQANELSSLADDHRYDLCDSVHADEYEQKAQNHWAEARRCEQALKELRKPRGTSKPRRNTM